MQKHALSSSCAAALWFVAAGLAVPLVAGCATHAQAVGAPASAYQPSRFSVEVRGAGPDVILIPGLASAPAVWEGHAARLAQTHRIHLVHVAGFAGADARANADGQIVAETAAEIARYIEAEGLRQPAIIGHSMGGVIGLMVGARHPEAVGRVLVVDALPFFGLLMMGPIATPDAVRPIADRLRDQMAAMDDDAFRTQQAAAMATLVKTDSVRGALLDWSMTSDRGVMARAMHEVIVTDLRPELASVTAPVTVLYAWDPAMPVAESLMTALYTQAYAGLPQVTLQEVSGAFHFIMMDQPEAFADAVQGFLSTP